jgi:type I restriction enzyme M protein
MFEQTFKNIDNAFREDDGCSTELDYAEQSSWILFLKWLDDFEKDKETKAKLENKQFKPTLKKEFQWSTWAVVKDKAGKVDFNKTLTGPDLKSFIDDKLFPYLKSFKNNSEDTNTLEYKIGEIFHEIKNKLSDGYSIREVVDAVDNLEFKSSEQKHELSALYEEKIKNMGNSGRNGGEYYTPRALIKSIIQIMNPKIGETSSDGAVGSAGFLIEAYEYMSKSKSLTTSELKTLQNKTFYGIEKISLAYVIGLMNMILHGIESPNIIRKNTLEDNIQEIQNKDRVDVILANPPFGGKTEKKHIQENFPIRTSETSYLFLQHFIKKLKVGGRASIVIKNTFLSNTDNASIALRKQLINECNLFAVLDLPGGAFLGTGVKTVVLFFEKGKPTKKLWYYQLNVGRNIGKTTPLNENDLQDFINLSKKQKISDNSWSIDFEKINKDTLDLSVKNPNTKELIDERTPEEIIYEIKKLEKESSDLLTKIEKIL